MKKDGSFPSKATTGAERRRSMVCLGSVGRRKICGEQEEAVLESNAE